MKELDDTEPMTTLFLYATSLFIPLTLAAWFFFEGTKVHPLPFVMCLIAAVVSLVFCVVFQRKEADGKYKPAPRAKIALGWLYICGAAVFMLPFIIAGASFGDTVESLCGVLPIVLWGMGMFRWAKSDCQRIADRERQPTAAASPSVGQQKVDGQ